MAKFVNIGHGNMISVSRIVAVLSPDAAPMKRLVQDAKEDGRALDATGGHKTRAVLVADTGHIILCGLQPETVSARLNGEAAEEPQEDKSEETEESR